jgi:hypothetical protein
MTVPRLGTGFSRPARVIFCGMADNPRPKNEQHQPAPRSRYAPPPIATPDYAPAPKRMTGLLIVIGITIIALAVWFLMRLSTFAPQAG